MNMHGMNVKRSHNPYFFMFTECMNLCQEN